MTFLAKLFGCLLIFAIGYGVGYFIKDNVSKPDQIINNKIKQKGQNNVLNFLQNRIFKKKT